MVILEVKNALSLKAELFWSMNVSTSLHPEPKYCDVTPTQSISTCHFPPIAIAMSQVILIGIVTH